MRAGAAAEQRAADRSRARRRRSTVEPAGIALRDLVERGDRALVALDRDHPARALRRAARGSARRARGRSRPRSTPSSGPAARAMRPVRLRSSRKFWPSDFLAARPCRRITSRSGGRSSTALMRSAAAAVRLPASAAGGKPRRKLERGDQARRIGLAGAGDVEGGAVVGRGAHERQAERDVDRVVERQRLDRDQRLVVIHAERGVVGLARRPRGTWSRPAAGRAHRCRRRSAARSPAAPRSGPRRRACRPRRHAD